MNASPSEIRAVGRSRAVNSSQHENRHFWCAGGGDIQPNCISSPLWKNAAPTALDRPKPRTPRPYQSKLIADLRQSMRSNRRVLLHLPTGGGKTFIASTIAKGAAAKGKRVIFLVHRIELLEQASLTFTDEGIDHGVIVAGQPTPDAKIMVAMAPTLVRRLGNIIAPDLVFVDEAHHAAAGTWATILAAFPQAWVVGLTATPCRLDGKGLRGQFNDMVMGPSVGDLMAGGFLAPYRAFAPSTPNMSGVHTRAGDFVVADMEDDLCRSTVVGDVVAHYQRLATGRRAIMFAASIRHSRALVEAFAAAGVAAEHLDGNTPAAVRASTIADFAAGRLSVLSNVGLFGEGFDVPAVEAVILARPTKSLSLHLQMIGRALRTAPGKTEAIVLDHAGNLQRLGFPDDDFTWSLDGVEKKKRKAGDAETIKQCPECYAVHRPAPTCPECGHSYAPQPREVEEVDGELQEVTRDTAPRMRDEQAECRTLDDLIRLGIRRGMKNPHGWARHVWRARQGRKAA